jgi:hypothetical protein
MHPWLRRLNQTEAKTRGAQRVIRIIGGIPGDTSPICRVDAGRLTLAGRFPDLQAEPEPVDLQVESVSQDSTAQKVGNAR